MKHANGEVVEHMRWCAVCDQYHATLYLCEHYPEPIKADIERKSKAYRALICSSEFAEKHGPDVTAISKFFAGIEE